MMKPQKTSKDHNQDKKKPLTGSLSAKGNTKHQLQKSHKVIK